MCRALARDGGSHERRWADSSNRSVATVANWLGSCVSAALSPSSSWSFPRFKGRLAANSTRSFGPKIDCPSLKFFFGALRAGKHFRSFDVRRRGCRPDHSRKCSAGGGGNADAGRVRDYPQRLPGSMFIFPPESERHSASSAPPALRARSCAAQRNRADSGASVPTKLRRIAFLPS